MMYEQMQVCALVLLYLSCSRVVLFRMSHRTTQCGSVGGSGCSGFYIRANVQLVRVRHTMTIEVCLLINRGHSSKSYQFCIEIYLCEGFGVLYLIVCILICIAGLITWLLCSWMLRNLTVY